MGPVSLHRLLAQSHPRPKLNRLTQLVDIPLAIAVIALFSAFVWLAMRSV